jgi:hypothetical protein
MNSDRELLEMIFVKDEWTGIASRPFLLAATGFRYY